MYLLFVDPKSTFVPFLRIDEEVLKRKIEKPDRLVRVVGIVRDT